MLFVMLFVDVAVNPIVMGVKDTRTVIQFLADIRPNMFTSS